MNRIRPLPSLIVAVSFLLCGPKARANEAHLTIKGGSPKYRRGREHPHIQLISERVRATIYPPRRGKKDFKARVACAFVFKNHSNRPVKVTMGFPEHGRGGLRLKDVLLRKFRSTVDGKRVRVRRKVVRAASPYRRSRALHRSRPRSRPRSSSFGVGNFPTPEMGNVLRAFHVKKVRFGPGQVRTVRVRYWQKLSFVGNRTSFSFDYILTTGATWKGKIERAQVRVEFKGRRKVWLDKENTTQNYHRHRRTLTWVFTRFEPRDDLSVDFTTHRTLKKELGDFCFSGAECNGTKKRHVTELQGRRPPRRPASRAGHKSVAVHGLKPRKPGTVPKPGVDPKPGANKKPRPRGKKMRLLDNPF